MLYLALLLEPRAPGDAVRARLLQLAQANERILPIILRSSSGAAGAPFKADWRKLRMARQPVPGLAKDCGPSTDNPVPFVSTWVRDLTENWW